MIVVDRIEGDRAILEIDGETVEIPRAALPPGAQEGSRLQLMALPEDADALAKAQARIQRLAARTKLPDDFQL